MKESFLATLIGLLLLLVAELHIFLKPQPTEKELKELSRGFATRTQWVGKYAPPFELATTQNGRFDLSESVGKKVIVLNFFATWCGPCRAEMPEFERYFEKHNDGSFMLLAIDAQETADQVAGFVHEFKMSFPVGIDDGHVLRLYEISGYPTTIFIGVDGKVQLYEVGAVPNADVTFDAMLRMNQQMLAAGKAISTADYLKQANMPPSPHVPADSVVLDARAKRIADRMDCPCGCDLRVAACNCRTARNIKKSLAAGKFGSKSDAEIVKVLNKKFCMGEM